MKSVWLLGILVSLTACANVAVTHEKPLTLSAVPICYNANCNKRAYIQISEHEWQPIAALFKNPHENPLQERLAIRKAIASFENIAGRYTPTHNDKEKNNNPFDDDGRMDCVDESTNTTNYLKLLEQSGYLRWHRVEPRAYRSHFLLDQHFTARISERKSSKIYAVDSWHRDNGEPPYIQEYSSWLFKLAYSKLENPD